MKSLDFFLTIKNVESRIKIGNGLHLACSTRLKSEFPVHTSCSALAGLKPVPGQEENAHLGFTYPRSWDSLPSCLPICSKNPTSLVKMLMLLVSHGATAPNAAVCFRGYEVS